MVDTTKTEGVAEVSSSTVPATKTEKTIDQVRNMIDLSSNGCAVEHSSGKASTNKGKDKEDTGTKKKDMVDVAKTEGVAEVSSSTTPAGETEETINQGRKTTDLDSSEVTETHSSKVYDKFIDKTEGCEDEPTTNDIDSISTYFGEHKDCFWRSVTVLGVMLGAGCLLMMSRANKGVKADR